MSTRTGGERKHFWRRWGGKKTGNQDSKQNEFLPIPSSRIISGLLSEGGKNSEFYQAYSELHPQVIASMEAFYRSEYEKAYVSVGNVAAMDEVMDEAINSMVHQSVNDDLSRVLLPRICKSVLLDSNDLWEMTNDDQILNQLYQVIKEFQLVRTGGSTQSESVVSQLLSSIQKTQSAAEMVTFRESPDAVVMPLLFELCLDDTAVSVFLTATEMKQLGKNSQQGRDSTLKEQIRKILRVIQYNQEYSESENVRPIKALFPPEEIVVVEEVVAGEGEGERKKVEKEVDVGVKVEVHMRAIPYQALFDRLNLRNAHHFISPVTCSTTLPTAGFFTCISSGSSSLVTQLDEIISPSPSAPAPQQG
ncbi:MAG: hypothetical protein GKR77_00245 [Legionellales bacterium]|nr:hypothetical protein [Legionellales bacterium]